MAKTKQTKVKHYTKRDYMAFAYLAPWIIGMLVLQLYPFLSSLAYSFCNYKITGTPQFAGLANYVQLFTLDNEFWNSLKVTLVYTLYTVPGKLVMALAVAAIASGLPALLCGAEAVEKSWPAFWSVLRGLGAKVELSTDKQEEFDIKA